MSHHYSGPDYAFPHGDARLNFTDLYVFPKAGEVSKSMGIMNVHASVGFNPPGPTTTDPFSPDALYEVMIDTDGDDVVDIAYSVRFTSNREEQSTTLRRIEGTRSDRTGGEGELIVQGAPVSPRSESKVTDAGQDFFAKSAYLAGEPANAARFTPVFAHALEHTGSYTPDEAARVAHVAPPHG